MALTLQTLMHFIKIMNYIKKNFLFIKKTITILTFLFYVVLPVTLFAQIGGTGPGGPGGGTGSGTDQNGSENITLDFELNNPLAGSGVNTINDFVKRLLDIVLTIGVPVVAVFIILAGFQFVTARGNSAKIEKAKENLLAVMIGSAVLLGAWVLANALGETVNELVTP